jgi:hypothetical protein
MSSTAINVRVPRRIVAIQVRKTVITTITQEAANKRAEQRTEPHFRGLAAPDPPLNAEM